MSDAFAKNLSPFDGIDRGVAPTSLQWTGPCRPLDEETIREGLRLMQAQERDVPKPMLLPAGLFEIVHVHGWGKEALAWCNARYAEQFGAPK